MRQEAAEAIRAEGWSKKALDKMVKIDSFLRESQRVYGITLGTFSLHVFSICTRSMKMATL